MQHAILPKQRDEDFFVDPPCLDVKKMEILEFLVQNRSFSKCYVHLAKELQALDPKHPKDIYKMHLVEGSTDLNAKNAGAPRLCPSGHGLEVRERLC